MIDDPRLRIFTEDGRNFLRKSEKYDLIILDAYSKSYVPFHLMTVEFFEEVYNHLNPGGVVASNLIASLIGDTSDLLRAEHKTISQFFPQIYLFYTRSSSAAELQNLMLVATTSIERRSPEQLMEIALSKPQPCISLPSYSRKVFDYPLSVSDVPILTDDYAPAENLLNPVTLAAYESGDELNTSALFNPLLLAATACSLDCGDAACPRRFLRGATRIVTGVGFHPRPPPRGLPR